LGEWNFDKSKIDEFTAFLAEVSEKLKFDYLSPFNEPQWDWGPEGGNPRSEAVAAPKST
jgi:hypothetical protein